jgi:hypothetical protein
MLVQNALDWWLLMQPMLMGAVLTERVPTETDGEPGALT